MADNRPFSKANQPAVHTFVFNWFKYNRYGKVFQRKNTITATSLFWATEAFKREFGNPRHVCITSVQEIDSEGNPIENSVKLNPTDFSIVDMKTA